MNVTNGVSRSAVDSRHLRLILAIVDEGSLTRAARRLHLTQSALSHQLKQIESQLGLPLFLRHKRRLVLSDVGQWLIQRARPIVADLDSLGDDLRGHSDGSRGRLRIATECYTLYEWLPRVLQRFTPRHPHVDVEIVPEVTHAPLPALARGDLDLAIVTSVPNSPPVEVFDLFRDELVLVVPPGHRLARRAYVRPQDLEKERLLLYTPPAENFFYRDFFARAPQQPARIEVVRLTEALLSMVRAGLGVTVSATWAIASELKSGRLIGVRLGAKGHRRTWRAVVRHAPSGRTPDYVKDFVALVAGSAGRSRGKSTGRRRVKA